MKSIKGISADVIIRMVVLVVALLNQVLVTMGYQELPWSGDQVGAAISTLITIAASLWCWWKNNSVTKAAITADKVLAVLKDGIVTAEEIEKLCQPEKDA